MSDLWTIRERAVAEWVKPVLAPQTVRSYLTTTPEIQFEPFKLPQLEVEPFVIPEISPFELQFEAYEPHPGASRTRSARGQLMLVGTAWRSSVAA